MMYFVSGLCVAKPRHLRMSTSSENADDSSVNYTCKANVGRPAGHIHWIKVVGTEEEDILDKVCFLSSDCLENMV